MDDSRNTNLALENRDISNTQISQGFQEKESIESLTPSVHVRPSTPVSATYVNRRLQRHGSFVLPKLSIVKEEHHHHTQVPQNPPTIEESPTQKEFERKNLWHCCHDIVIDKRLITYIVQVCISLIVLLFCMYKLTNQSSDEDPTIWVSLISGIVGNYLPSVQLK